MNTDLRIEGFSYQLREVNISDAEFILDIRLEDQERNQFINPVSPDVELQKSWIQKYLQKEDDYYFIIENIFTHEPEGLIGLYDIDNKKAEWGRWVIKKGSLAATESVYLILKFAFNRLKLQEIYCRTLSENTPALSFHDALPELRRPSSLSILFKGTPTTAIEHYITFAHHEETLKPILRKKCVQLLERNSKKLLSQMEFHHLGVAGTSIEKDFETYQIMGYSKESPIFEDSQQGIKGLFITRENFPRLELLEPLAGSSTLDSWIHQRSKIYHMAYLVEDIELFIKVFMKNGAKLVSGLKCSTYFKKRICFLMLKNLQLIELIER